MSESSSEQDGDPMAPLLESDEHQVIYNDGAGTRIIVKKSPEGAAVANFVLDVLTAVDVEKKRRGQGED
jgi:hypothetical protein